MDWDCVNLLLHDDWVRDFDGNFNWVGNFHFFNDGNFDDFIFWDFLVVVLVNGVNGNVNASHMMFTGDCFHVKLKIHQRNVIALTVRLHHRVHLELELRCKLPQRRQAQEAVMEVNRSKLFLKLHSFRTYTKPRCHYEYFFMEKP